MALSNSDRIARSAPLLAGGATVKPSVDEDEVLRIIDKRIAQLDLRRGRDGRDGVDGRDGTDGTPGVPGRAGEAGRDGIDGRDGRDGTDGRDGKDGRNGQDAPKIDRIVLKDTKLQFFDTDGQGIQVDLEPVIPKPPDTSKHIVDLRIERDLLIATHADGSEEAKGRIAKNVKTKAGGGTTRNAAASAARELKVKTVTSDYTVENWVDIVNADASTGAITITIPSAVGWKRDLLVKRINSNQNNVTVISAGGEQIEREDCRILNQNFWSLRLYSDQTEWWEY